MNNRCFMIGLLLTSLFPVIQQTQAANQPTNAFQNGLYLGGALGADWGSATWNGVSEVNAVNDNSTPLNIFNIFKSWVPNGRSKITELAGRAMLGYQFVQAPIYLAAELGGTFSNEQHFNLNTTKTFSDSAFMITFIKVNATTYDEVTLGGAEFNLDLKPGWLFNENFLVYGRAGLAVNTLRIQNAGTWINNSSFFGAPITLAVQDSSTNHKSVYGTRLGFGAEYLFIQNLGVTVDYIYTNYGHISTIAQASASDHSLGFNTQVNIDGLDAPEVSVSTQALMVGFLYHW